MTWVAEYATIPFTKGSLICLDVLCPSLFSESVHSTVTMSYPVVKYVWQMKTIKFGVILVQKGQMSHNFFEKKYFLEFLVIFSKTKACNISLYLGEML